MDVVEPNEGVVPYCTVEVASLSVVNVMSAVVADVEEAIEETITGATSFVVVVV